MENLNRIESEENIQASGSKESPLTVDVIIPIYKPDDTFKQSIERLCKQSVKPNNIILLHTKEYSSAYEVSEQIGKYESLLTYAQNLSTLDCNIKRIDIEKADFDHGGTRNYGASLSKSEIVMFMTQDAVPANKELIKNLLDQFENPQIGAAYGRQLVNNQAGTIEKYTRTFNYPAKSLIKSQKDMNELGIKTYFCSNVCAAYRKTVYEQLGGFVTKTIFNEDMIMAAGIINAGYSIAYTADAMVIHSHKYTYRQQFQRNFDLAVSQQQYKEIFNKVKSENEGKKLVMQTLQYLVNEKKYILIPDLILQSGFKYLGYKTGKQYDKIPKRLIKKLSMNPGYWK